LTIKNQIEFNVVNIWNFLGNLVTNYQQHTNEAYNVAFSNDGTKVASTSYDRIIMLWRIDGTTLDSFGNIDTVADIRFAPDSLTINGNKVLISGGWV